MEGTDPRRPRYAALLVGLLLLLLGAVVLGLSVGAVSIPAPAILRFLLSRLGIPVSSDTDPFTEAILAGLRLPRVLVAAAAGALLGLAGALLQGSLRNPLAEPATTGTAAGALLGASLALLAGPLGAEHLVNAPPTPSTYAMRIGAATLLAFLASLLVIRVARSAGRVAVGPLLLAGLAINAIVGALAGIILFLGTIGAQTAATVITNWSFGGLLAAASLGQGTFLSVLGLLALGAGLLQHRELDQILVGEEEAAAAGVPVARTRLTALALAALATGAAVATVGVLAFVGLLAPHLVRRWTGPGHLRLLPSATLMGASLLVLADALGRVLAAPSELPVGVVTAALGAPLLLVLLQRILRGTTT